MTTEKPQWDKDEAPDLRAAAARLLRSWLDGKAGASMDTAMLSLHLAVYGRYPGQTDRMADRRMLHSLRSPLQLSNGTTRIDAKRHEGEVALTVGAAGDGDDDDRTVHLSPAQLAKLGTWIIAQVASGPCPACSEPKGSHANGCPLERRIRT